MGGGLMETAQNATQLEVRYAQARAELAQLAQENAQLQVDLSAMVELKLQLAEARAVLQEAVEAGFSSATVSRESLSGVLDL
mmetsp:Transcript_2624/g.6530  ORF Transcript_2624/g.6530 Transcript_2624/m.6530 type:complete len:82 (-) Transcript_2624:177-422(-)